jgi:nucleoside 2-deoxyribosyltransferase
MMPFSGPFQGYYEQIFSPTIRDVGLHPVKVDEIYTATQISSDIFALVQQADIILADVTGKNPNVNYELGIAHALGKKTVIITQKPEDVPFDYRHIRYIAYRTTNAGWEKKLKDNIRLSLLASLAKNVATSVIAGQELDSLRLFLENIVLDTSYEVSKESHIQSDENGNCSVQQQWNVKAKTDVTAIIHGIVGDEPGSIRLTKAYDRTNGVVLNTIASRATETSIRYILFLNKLLRAGEQLQFDIEYIADNYISDLFKKGRVTIFQRPNTRRGVYYTYRRDSYSFPITEYTKAISVKLNGSAPDETSKIEILDDKVSVIIDRRWQDPYAGHYSYELIYS